MAKVATAEKKELDEEVKKAYQSRARTGVDKRPTGKENQPTNTAKKPETTKQDPKKPETKTAGPPKEEQKPETTEQEPKNPETSTAEPKATGPPKEEQKQPQPNKPEVAPLELEKPDPPKEEAKPQASPRESTEPKTPKEQPKMEAPKREPTKIEQRMAEDSLPGMPDTEQPQPEPLPSTSASSQPAKVESRVVSARAKTPLTLRRSDNTVEGRMDQLLDFWVRYQSTISERRDRLIAMETSLHRVEDVVDRFVKFCGDYQLMWKITNFRQKFDSAASEQNMVMVSPTFDSHRNGYKLQMSLCPNGDGKAKGRAMSLFFAVLKGPYDTLLPWPFIHPVTMTLLDQAEDESEFATRHDVSMTFTPNPIPENMPFLGKPTGPKNHSLGFPKFIGLTELFEGNYIKEDTMFIKVLVRIVD